MSTDHLPEKAAPSLAVNLKSVSPAGGMITVVVEYSDGNGWVLDETYTFTGPGIAAQAKMKVGQRVNDLAAMLQASAALQNMVGPMVIGG